MCLRACVWSDTVQHCTALKLKFQIANIYGRCGWTFSFVCNPKSLIALLLLPNQHLFLLDTPLKPPNFAWLFSRKKRELREARFENIYIYIYIKIAVLCDVTPPVLDVAVGVSAENTGAIFRQIKLRTWKQQVLPKRRERCTRLQKNYYVSDSKHSPLINLI